MHSVAPVLLRMGYIVSLNKRIFRGPGGVARGLEFYILSILTIVIVWGHSLVLLYFDFGVTRR